MLKNRKKKGFTLIELVIVIAIIGILVAIALPRFADATQGAKNRSIDAAARSIAGAMTQHYANNLKWPAKAETTATDETKKTILKAAGLKVETDADVKKWGFEKVNTPATSSGGATTAAQDVIKITYKWENPEDQYTGSIGTPNSAAKSAVFEF